MPESVTTTPGKSSIECIPSSSALSFRSSCFQITYELVIRASMPYLSHISRGSIVRRLGLTTGSRVGVFIGPCAVCSRPILAAPSRVITSNRPRS